jgi:glycosyltransferase involved in cell wall biosynthesis
MPRVLFAERRLVHYRVPLLRQLVPWLAGRGVELHFAHGAPAASEVSRRDAGEWPDARALPTRYWVGERLVWMPVPTAGYDLVVCDHANRLLFNLWLCRAGRPFRLAWFGHGTDFAGPGQGVREALRRFTLRRADWWFAYTERTRRVLLEAGFAPGRITVVDNAVDTSALRAGIAAQPPAAVRAVRDAHGLVPGKTALFIGSLYAAKGLDRLVAVARRVSAADAQFRLLVVGDGPQREALLEQARGVDALRWLGALNGDAKARVMAACDFLLLPAAVGLAVLDGFAAGLPLLATDAPGHGPEIAYLEPGRNGTLTAPAAAALADAVVGLLQDPSRLARWRAAAAQDGQRFTVEAMAARFGQGVLDALAAPLR